MTRRHVTFRLQPWFLLCVLVVSLIVVSLQSALPANAVIGPWAPGTFSKIVSRGTTTCAIAEGKAYCWGKNSRGQLGNGTSTNSLTPVPVSMMAGVLAGKTVTDISVGGTSAATLGHVCVVASGAAYCWGANGNGQLGNNTTSTGSTTTPVTVTASAGLLAGKTVTSISAGDAHTCAVASGVAYCWGAGGNGRLGRNSTAQSTVPVAVTTGVLPATTVTGIAAMASHSCAFASGAAYCWGINTNGQLGNNSTTQSLVPVAVTVAAGGLSGKTVTSVSGGNATSCVLASGFSYCWGLNANGQLGNNSTTQSLVPVAPVLTGVLSGKTLTAVSNQSGNTCVLDTAGLAYCWGTLYTGGSPTSSQVPVAVTTSGVLSGITLTTVVAGDRLGCGTGTDNRAYCWGSNTNGGLGDNTTTARTQPVMVLSDVLVPTTANSGYRFYQNADSLTPGSPLALTNTPAELTSPGQAFRLRTDIAPDVAPTSTSIAVAEFHSCALIVEGPMCWGSNDQGQHGNGSTTQSNVPTPVTTTGVLDGKSISAIAAGGNHTCAVASGAAYCWGFNDQGQLGDNSTSTRTTPVAVSTAGVLAGKTVTAISTGYQHTCAIASGAVYCWGHGGLGQLGNGGSTSSSVPVAVDMSGVLAGKTVTAIEAGDLSTCVVASGAAYCWGDNSEGSVGDGTTNNRNVPVAVTATGVLAGKTVTDVSVGWRHACVIASGAAYCWGYGNDGGLGDSTNNQSLSPVAVNTTGVLAGKTVTSVTASGYHTCAIASGAGFCWGLGASGQLGQGSSSSNNVPVAVSTSGVLSGAVLTGIMAGHNEHTCAIASAGVYCWGLNSRGQLGNNSTTGSNIAVTTGRVTNLVANASYKNFKLQFATRTATVCAAQTTGFSDVSGSTSIAYATNPSVSHNTAISAVANDPTPAARTTALQYITQSSFSNGVTIPAGKVGLLDFSLRDNSAAANTSYCLRIVSDTGATFDTATVFPEIKTAAGGLGLSIVNGSGAVVPSPTFSFPLALFSTSCQAVSTMLGTNTQLLRIANTGSATGWSVSIAPTGGATDLWNRSDNNAKYDFNDPSGSPAGCNSGSDGDGFAGQLLVDPVGADISPQSGCSTTGISSGTMTGFVQGSVDSVTLLSGSTSTPVGCYWDVKDIEMNQTIPANQPAGAYSINMMATVVAS